jgi:hypothetical protein
MFGDDRVATIVPRLCCCDCVATNASSSARRRLSCLDSVTSIVSRRLRCDDCIATIVLRQLCCDDTITTRSRLSSSKLFPRHQVSNCRLAHNVEVLAKAGNTRFLNYLVLAARFCQYHVGCRAICEGSLATCFDLLTNLPWLQTFGPRIDKKLGLHMYTQLDLLYRFLTLIHTALAFSRFHKV